jgi:hypothetical protein
MNGFKSTLVVAALMGTSALAFANDDMKKEGGMMHADRMHAEMKSMDTNGDGMISREEFMKFQEDKWEKLPKNKDGLVMMSDMEKMHHDEMMKHDDMKKDAMKDGDH